MRWPRRTGNGCLPGLRQQKPDEDRQNERIFKLFKGQRRYKTKRIQNGRDRRESKHVMNAEEKHTVTYTLKPFKGTRRASLTFPKLLQVGFTREFSCHLPCALLPHISTITLINQGIYFLLHYP